MSEIGDCEPGGDPLYQTQVDFERELAAVGVIHAVSELEDVDPTEFDVTLYDVVDPGALDAVLRSGGDSIVVNFFFAGYRVFVDAGGEIRIYEPDD